MKNKPYFRYSRQQKGIGFGSFLLLLALALIFGLAWAYWYLHKPLAFAPSIAQPRIEVRITPGSSGQSAAMQLSDAGLEIQPSLLALWWRLSGAKIKAGDYEIPRGTNLLAITRKLQEGSQTLHSLTIPEGWNLKQIRQLLRQKNWLRQDSRNMSEQELLAAINIPALPTLEGYLAPDTYLYPRDTSDLVFFRQAAKKMQTDIRTAWEQRAEDLAISSPAEMVNLASIIEKETAHPSDRNSVAAVFHNRLKIDMPLQTDPTVIYGMGETYRGNIRKVDLQTDTPWNTYTRRGLPATPIAMPGRAALLAAVQPAPTDALYFVSLNDGSGKSHFSNNLNAHNQAVQRYILKRP